MAGTCVRRSTSPVRFPELLHPRARIAVTSPSSGGQAECVPRLDLVLDHVRTERYEVIEGERLRDEYEDARGSFSARARPLRFLLDPSVDAILTPRGGEPATELLEAVDFDGPRTTAEVDAGRSACQHAADAADPPVRLGDRLTVLNGARASVTFGDGRGALTQWIE